MNKPVIFSDRRAYTRSRVCKGAKILFNARASVLDCTVRNISDAGACLVVATPAVLPPEFELSIEGHAAVHYCKVVWHCDLRIGVAFVARSPKNEVALLGQRPSQPIRQMLN